MIWLYLKVKLICRFYLLLFNAKLCLPLCDPMDCSILGFPVLQNPPRFTQTHVRCADDAIQPSHPLSPPLLPPSVSPSIRIFSMCWLFTPGGPGIGASASVSVLPMNSQGWFPLGWTDLILLCKRLSKVFSSTTFWKHLWCSALLMVQLSHPYMTTGKTMSLTIWTFIGKVMSLLFNILPRFAIAFLPRRKYLLISWLQFSVRDWINKLSINY